MPAERNHLNMHAIRLASLLLVLAAACGDTHTVPQTGTETGNPVLRGDLVSLVVSADEVHIVGARGAVSPGGCGVRIDDTATGHTVETKSNGDGAFDAQVDGQADDSYIVRASCGTKLSSAVYVVRGRAVVIDDTQALSCNEQTEIAAAQRQLAVATADVECKAASDCAAAALGTVCNDSCSDIAVSKLGATQIAAAIDDIADGVCSSFEADGCNILALPCPGPHSQVLSCRAGRCTFADEEGPFPPDAGLASDASVDEPDSSDVFVGDDCDAAFDVGDRTPAVFFVYWHDPASKACLSRTWSGSGGNGNRFGSFEACRSVCPAPTSQADCVAPRVFTTQCLGCTEADECSVLDTLCALPCDDASDCAQEPEIMKACFDTCRNVCG